ncbi:MAG: A/G-specific adenine glycosylase [Burkholderiales bacterium]
MNFAERVLAWQATYGRRDLPWQASRDPYRVWLSEVMLQQTQVATVRGYFSRFISRFPDVRALAAADADAVLALWSGLGYYSRARNLHRCARQVMEQHGGEFPNSAALLETLPGIGRSTAAAIAAFCFGERVAIFDGNVRRVLARALGFDADLAVPANERALWRRATELLPERDSMETMPRYTQGLMDLGATVCHARKPACARCPLAEICVAMHAGEPERLPVRARKLVRKVLDWWLLIARDERGAVWLERRPESGIWAGLHCLPVYESEEALEFAIASAHRSQQGEAVLDSLPPIVHKLTHRDLRLHPVIARIGPHDWPSVHRAAESIPDGDGTARMGCFMEPSEWADRGLPAPIRVLIDTLQEQ